MKKYLLILALMPLTGCAAMFSGTTQTFRVKAIDADTGQELTGVKTEIMVKGNEFITQDQSPITFKKGANQITISSMKAGYKPFIGSVEADINHLIWLNILNASFFGVGFIVDFATGAWRDYPEQHVIKMRKAY